MLPVILVNAPAGLLFGSCLSPSLVFGFYLFIYFAMNNTQNHLKMKPKHL